MGNPLLSSALAVSLFVFGGAAGMATAQPAADTIQQDFIAGEEALAYSNALQAYLYVYPLFISDREVKRAERLTAPVANAPQAPMHRFGHMKFLATADSDMPYSPNPDVVYSGLGLDLSAEPIIFDMPAIKDRYAIVQITNAYLENQPYVFAPLANGQDAVTVALVGPDWSGTLPDGVSELRIDTNLAFLAVRIAVYEDTDLPVILDYQDKMSITALSDWDGGPSATPPPIPAPRERKTYDGPFARFHEAADLLALYPPPARHRAMNSMLWRVGLVPGEPFDPAALSPAAQRGVMRALEDGPKVIDYLRRNRGKTFPTGWDAGRYAERIEFDYAARAAMALVGLMGNDPEEAIYFYTYFDSEQAPLDGSRTYRMHFEANELPQLVDRGFWSLTMYDGVNFKFVDNEIDRYALGSRSDLTFNEDGSLDIWVQPGPPEATKMSNWLPTPQEGPFRITLRIYAPAQEVVDALYDGSYAVPPLVPAN